MDDIIKPFAGSYSRLKGYDDCPRRYYETTVLKGKWPEERSAMLEEGDEVHAAIALALKTNTPLPTKFKPCQKWVDSVRNTPGELLIEEDCKWAITRDFQPTAWFSKTVWWRAVADAVVLDGDCALVVDWKWGRSQNADPIQLVMLSLIMFIHFPELQAIRSEFVWLQEDDSTTQTLYREEAADQWAEIMPRIQLFEQASLAQNFPPKPNRYCRSWCPVKTCEFWGR
jgi:hypothetical protein